MQLRIDDQGYLGAGGAKVDLDAVLISVTPVNDAPVAAAEAYEVDNDKVLAVSAPGVLIHAVDVDGDPLTIRLVSRPAGGSLVLQPDGSFRYEPDINFSGSDTFTYLVDDGQATSAVTTVTITVHAAVGPTDGDPTPDDDPNDSGDDGDIPDDIIDIGGLPPAIGDDDQDGDDCPPASTHDPHEGPDDVQPSILNPLVITLDYDGIQSAGYFAARQVRAAVREAVAAAVPEAIKLSAEQLLAALDAGTLWESLDQLREELAAQVDQGTFVVGTAAAATAVMSVGYVAWALRGSYLLASVLSTLPAWRLMDPLPVLAAFEDDDNKRRREPDDDDALETMVGEEATEAGSRLAGE